MGKYSNVFLIILLLGFVVFLSLNITYISLKNENLEDELSQCNVNSDAYYREMTESYSIYFNEHNKTLYLQKELNISSQQAENLTNKIINLEQDRTSLINELSNEYKKYNGLREQKGITKATYSEVKQFLREDKTNEGEWIKFHHDCTQFAAELMNNSWRKGIQACVVELEYLHRYGHDLVYFPLSDREGIFIEPQDDSEVEGLKKGVKYCNLMDWNCDYCSKIIGLTCPCCK